MRVKKYFVALLIMLFLPSFLVSFSATQDIRAQASGEVEWGVVVGSGELYFEKPPVKGRAFGSYRWPSDFDNPPPPGTPPGSGPYAGYNGWAYFSNPVGGGYGVPPTPMTNAANPPRYTSADGTASVGPNPAPPRYTANPSTTSTVKIALHADLSGSTDGEDGVIGSGGVIINGACSAHVYICPSAADGTPNVTQRTVLHEWDSLAVGTWVSEPCPEVPVTVSPNPGFDTNSGDGITVHHCNWIIWEFDLAGHGPIPEISNMFSIPLILIGTGIVIVISYKKR